MCEKKGEFFLVMMTFGQRLRHFRKYILKNTRQELSDRLDISKGTIETWETERTNMSKSSLDLLTYKLKDLISQEKIPFNMEWLLNGTGEILIQEKSIGSIKAPSTQSSGIIKTYKVSSFLYEPIIKNGTVLNLKKIFFHEVKSPSIIGYKDKSNVYYFGIVLMSQNNQLILHHYSGSMQLLVLSEHDDLYSIISLNTEEALKSVA